MYSNTLSLQSTESSEMGSCDLNNMADLRSAMCHLVEAEVSISGVQYIE